MINEKHISSGSCFGCRYIQYQYQPLGCKIGVCRIQNVIVIMDTDLGIEEKPKCQRYVTTPWGARGAVA